MSRSLILSARGDVDRALEVLGNDAVPIASALVYQARSNLGKARGLLLQELEVRQRVGQAQDLERARQTAREARP